MAIYTYSKDSLIDGIEILTNEKGGSRAYIHARGDASPEDISRIQKSFESRGWFGVPCLHKGRAVLELRGFKKPEELTAYLQLQGFTDGSFQVAQTKDDHQSAWDKFKAATLKFTGWAYIGGDAAFMTYAGMEQYKHNKALKKANAAMDAVTNIAKIKPDLSADDIAKLRKDHGVIRDIFSTAERYGEKAPNLTELTKALEGGIHAAKDGVGGGKFKLASGLGYAAGSLVLAGYGSRDQSHIEIQRSVQKIERFLKTEGLTSPDSKRTLLQEPEKTKKSLVDHANNVLRRFPSETLNLIYMGVGLALMGSSFKQISKLGGEIKPAKQALDAAKKAGKTGALLEDLSDAVSGISKSKREEIIDVGLGTITASSALAGIAIKEKKPIEGQKKREGLAGVWDWIQEQPLRLTGYGYMVATGFHAWATVEKWQPNKAETKAIKELEGLTGLKGTAALKDLKGLAKDNKISPKSLETLEDFKFRRNTLKGRGVFIAANVLAEVLMILSSKGHGEGVRNADVDESVIASTAEFISKQNPATQEQLIQRLAGYMSAPDVLGMKSEEIATNLRTQVASMGSNPWSQMQHEKQPIDVAPKVSPAVTAQPAKPTSKVSSVNLDSQRLAALNRQQLA